MARQSYRDDQNIHSMNTRQLRQYIADKAAEAQARLDSSDMSDASRAFKDAARDITNKTGTKVRRSTSNMSKEEMREYAYSLRQFNSLDQDSGFAKSIEWKENKSRYEKFIRNQIKNDKNGMWAQYITPKGNVSRKGFQMYKQYVQFLSAMKDSTEEFGYESLKVYFKQTLSGEDARERQRVVEKLLNQAFSDSIGKGWTPAELNKHFKTLLNQYDEKQAEKAQFKEDTKQALKNIKKVAKSVKAKPSAPSSKTKVPIKKARKLKEHGKVRRKSS